MTQSASLRRDFAEPPSFYSLYEPLFTPSLLPLPYGSQGAVELAKSRLKNFFCGLDLFNPCSILFCCCSRRRTVPTQLNRTDSLLDQQERERIVTIKHTTLMAAETGDPAAAGSKAPENDQPPAAPAPTQPQQSASPAADAKPAAGEAKPAKDPKAAAAKGGDNTGGEKELSNAERKKKAKEEKAARRAQAKAVQSSQPLPGQPGQAVAQGDGKGGQKQRQGSAAGTGQQQRGGNQARQATAAAPAAVAPKEVKPSIPECFSHLSLARRIPIAQTDKDVDHAVLVLGQHMSSFAISDSITRLEATLYAFKKVGIFLA